MTDDEAKALGLRAVACKGWRWMPGMLVHHGDREIRVTEESDIGDAVSGASYDDVYDVTFGRVARHAARPDQWPDFRDPATLGCLLALVRDAWGDAGCHARSWFDGSWIAMRLDDEYNGEITLVCATEAEALVAALEAAPRREVSPCEP